MRVCLSVYLYVCVFVSRATTILILPKISEWRRTIIVCRRRLIHMSVYSHQRSVTSYWALLSVSYPRKSMLQKANAIFAL